MSEEMTVLEFLKLHSEIKYVRLIYTWPYWATYIEKDILWDEQGKEIDEEYSYIGPNNENLHKFLENYDVWDFSLPEERWKSQVFSKSLFECCVEGEEYFEDFKLKEEPHGSGNILR